MLPGVSAEDCLFCDLNVDPASAGCQSLEATDFLMHQRSIDPASHLILWQVGFLCNFGPARQPAPVRGLPQLVQKLCRFYPAQHPVYIYEAALFPGVEPVIRGLPLFALPQAQVTTMSTLYIPPAFQPAPDYSMGIACGISPQL